MKRSKPFFYSLALHAAVVALFVGAIGTVRRISAPEEKIAVSLMAYAPQENEIRTPPPPEPAAETPPATEPPKKPEPPKAEPRKTILPTPQPQKSAQPTAQVAPVAPAAVPPSPAKPMPAEPAVVKAPPPAPAVDHQRAYEEEHLGRIRTLLAQNLVYPKNARRLNQQGDVVVMFSLSPAGEVGSIAITKSSGFELLDEAARNLIRTTSPQFPKPAKTVQISVPIGYRLR